MKFMLFVTLLTLANISLAKEVTIFIRDDVYEDYQEFLDGRDVLSIKNFSGKTIRRDVVDMILAQQALKLGGFPYNFNYFSGKVNFRNTKMLQQGKLLISFDSYWYSDAIALEEHVYISKPVIRKGEYTAGIYTSVDNKPVLAVKTLKQLQAFSAVSTPKWRSDWRTLKKLHLKKLVREDEWLSMARMVNLGWVDFMLMPFHSTADKSYSLDKIHLIPVPGVAIMLDDSRHYVISKKHPLGEKAFRAIRLGLIKLREEHKISKAYRQAGFFIDPNEYKILNQ